MGNEVFPEGPLWVEFKSLDGFNGMTPNKPQMVFCPLFSLFFFLSLFAKGHTVVTQGIMHFALSHTIL